LNKVHLTHRLKNGRTLSVVEDDITDEDVDTVVNAANELLRHSGGIAGAISLRGGPTIDDECRAWVDSHGPVTTGTAAIKRRRAEGSMSPRLQSKCGQLISWVLKPCKSISQFHIYDSGESVEGPVGFEPTTPGLKVRSSNR
jgi:hypothetical protein